MKPLQAMSTLGLLVASKPGSTCLAEVLCPIVVNTASVPVIVREKSSAVEAVIVKAVLAFCRETRPSAVTVYLPYGGTELANSGGRMKMELVNCTPSVALPVVDGKLWLPL